MRRILVTGGAGYIGSHTCKLLSAQGFVPVAYDTLTGGHRHAVKWGPLVVGDVADRDALHRVFNEHRIEAVVHSAANIDVGESVRDPEKYYRNNVAGTISLLEVMRKAGVNEIVFSSTAAVYGVSEEVPIAETAPLNPVNPYGRSKLAVEQILGDYARAYALRSVSLRYFNACGADAGGEIGEEHDPETHLIPRALMAVTGELSGLQIYGDDYETEDGTCIRDYIHVSDLARGHLAALDYLANGGATDAFNLGSGRGTSVSQILRTVREVAGRAVPVEIGPRRPGDPPVLLADPRKARERLGFTTEHSDIHNIVRTAWRFHQGAPEGDGRKRRHAEGVAIHSGAPEAARL